MTLIDTYLNLCTEVYDLSKPTAPKDAYDFYRSYAIDAHGRILEPMCGTGRFLLPLISEGFDVHGVDGSQHMLDALHKKSKDQNLKVNVWQGLVENLKIQEKYKLIFIPSGSFSLITDVEMVKNALQKFFDVLTDEGILVFEVETSKSVPTPIGVWRGSVWNKDDGKYILANFLTLPIIDNIVTTICRYELVNSISIIQTEIEYMKLRLYDDSNQLLSLLNEIGFSNVSILKAFDRNKQPDQNDESIIYECRK
jgi:SAM-dependent methyltransferase